VWSLGESTVILVWPKIGTSASIYMSINNFFLVE
jgi:hypothetical protein